LAHQLADRLPVAGASLIRSGSQLQLSSQGWLLAILAILLFLFFLIWFLHRSKQKFLKKTAQEVDLRIRIFQTGKSSESAIDCEDSVSISANKRRVVIADGVSQSFESGLWARTVTKHLLKTEIEKSEESAIASAAAEWVSLVEGNLTPSTSWNVRKKVEDGAQATFATVVFEVKDGTGSWCSKIVGDCLVVEIPSPKEFSSQLRLHPTDYSESRKSKPDTISSREPFVRGELRSFRGFVSVGARVLLMTDALGVFFAKKNLEGVPIARIFPFLSKDCINPGEEFKSWADALRPSEIDDDDLTLVEVTYE